MVVFRAASGQLGGLHAHCPHLGAHLAHGGVVVGETVRCPFHGFCFDATGACVATGYNTRPPPRARARRWPVIERHGLVLAWHDEAGREPTFDIPDVDTEDWTPFRRMTMRLRSHVQEIAENSVDIGHFAWVHHYTDIRQTGELETVGPRLGARYSLRRGRRALGRAEGFEVAFEIRQLGLGYALVEVRLAELGLSTRQLVLARPVDEDHVDLTIAMSIHRVDHPEKIHPLLWFAPRGLLTQLVARLSFNEYASDVLQDRAIWENKIWLPVPALAEGDGFIGRYRQWARQFYDRPGPLPDEGGVL